MAKDAAKVLSVDGHDVHITHPDKLYFSQARVSKLDLVRYYLSVEPGALAGIQDRPIVLKRFVNGAEGEAFYQKRAPDKRPPWLRTVTLKFPSGRTAEEIVVDNAAGLAWIVNLGCIELHPHAVRSGNLEHPDELRVDLDPIPGVSWADVRRVALEVQALLEEVGLRGWPKTSGSRGMHVNVRIEPRWTFTEVRRAAVALSRAVERRAPALASSKWWKEERHGVPGLQPECQGPNHVLRLFGAAPSRCPSFDPARVARGSGMRSCRFHDVHGSRTFRQDRQSSRAHGCRGRFSGKVA